MLGSFRRPSVLTGAYGFTFCPFSVGRSEKNRDSHFTFRSYTLLGLEPAKENSFGIKEDHGSNFPRKT